MKKLIYPYSSHFVDIFKGKKKEISELLRNVEIHHIGSTAIPNLGGKGIVDILIGINSWTDLENTIKKLKTIGFKHIHPRERGRVFLSKIRESKLGDIHIHIVKKSGKPCRELLFFRDYLRKNKKEAKRFFNLKLKWAKEAGENRIEYGNLKARYVKGILAQMGNFLVVKNPKKCHHY